jgi:hypothetical protein
MGSLASQRKALRERSESQTNILAVRLVPSTPNLLGQQSLGDEIYRRSPLPSDPSHILRPVTGISYDQSLFALQRSEGVSFERHHSTSKPVHSSIHSRDKASQEEWASIPKSHNSVVVNSDKTFRVLGELQTHDVLSSVASSASSVDSNNVDGHARSQPSQAPEGAIATSPAPASPATDDHHTTGSPWNYTIVGGLRKVPKTPDFKQKAVLNSDSQSSLLPGPSGELQLAPELSTKLSLQSMENASMTSENINYRVYGISSEPENLPTDLGYYLQGQQYQQPQVEDTQESLKDSNYQVLGRSAPTSEIDFDSENYQLHRNPSLSSNPLAQIRTEYSRESLVVPPLRPRAKHSVESFGYYKSHSRESLRTGSLTSISTILSQEAAQARVTSGSVIHIPAPKHLTLSSSWAATNPAQIHMQEHPHPHRWSPLLSTVLSEPDVSTDRGSRSWSDNNGRESSGFPSMHSRQLPSISSSLREEGHSGSISLETPQSAFFRSGEQGVTGPTNRVIEQDEDKDGLCPMADLRTKSSRTRDFGAISDNCRTNTMLSASSSRANSLLASSIPTWAKYTLLNRLELFIVLTQRRLYYGGGERRYRPPGSSAGADSRPQSSFRSGSPDLSNLPLSIYSPRRRPREGQPFDVSRQGGSMEISPPSPLRSDGAPINNPFSRRFRPSSSILSPHLRKDRRRTRSRGSTFFLEPASLDWSQGGGVLSRKKQMQIIMFIIGFIFPFGEL